MYSELAHACELEQLVQRHLNDTFEHPYCFDFIVSGCPICDWL